MFFFSFKFNFIKSSKKKKKKKTQHHQIRKKLGQKYTMALCYCYVVAIVALIQFMFISCLVLKKKKEIKKIIGSFQVCFGDNLNLFKSVFACVFFFFHFFSSVFTLIIKVRRR